MLKNVLSVVALFLIMIVMVVKVLVDWTTATVEANISDASLVLTQRNELSRSLNDVLQELGQAECKLLTPDKRNDVVNSRGGWCARIPGYNHVFDDGLASNLVPLFSRKTVGSFGEGHGLYKQFFDKHSTVYDAYDGAAYPNDVSVGPHIEFLDLSSPQYGLPVYDWVFSTAVGEHIPLEFEENYISNLLRHAKEGIVISWATPGQPGPGHVRVEPCARMRFD
eukprot:Polyplicarium_translucidae@DN2972_c0_g2_i1.p1